uniref:Homeobox domain-containing protein n=1 Tax=Denticeps clupeoides TaxID=299321 RepID=A0AAY4B199_9TELE
IVRTANGTLREGTADSDGGESGAASFSTNHNSVVCLPLVSEGLKLVWTQSDQTRELDAIPELVQAFNVFPYPTSREVSGLARLCALPLDKVKVWFMVQRIKYGISWASEDIEETRRKLAGLEHLSEHEDEAEPPAEPKPPSAHPSEPETLAPMAATAAALSSSSPSSSATSSPASVAAPPKCSSQTTAGSAKAGPAAASLAPPHQFTPAGRPRKTKEQLDVLKQHFLRCQWPKSEDYTQLVELTALPRADVIQWFGDTRYAVKNGQLRWVRKRKSHGSGSAKTAAAATDLPDVQPLELYHRQNRVLQEKDLDALCRKSRMSYQQVRDWFASRDGEAPDPHAICLKETRCRAEETMLSFIW